MQVILKNAPYIFARHPSGRAVQIAGRAGDVGKIANIVVPDERVISHLKPVVRYLEKLQPRQFNYGANSGYAKYPHHPHKPVKAVQFNRMDSLPLFEKR